MHTSYPSRTSSTATAQFFQPVTNHAQPVATASAVQQQLYGSQLEHLAPLHRQVSDVYSQGSHASPSASPTVAGLERDRPFVGVTLPAPLQPSKSNASHLATNAARGATGARDSLLPLTSQDALLLGSTDSRAPTPLYHHHQKDAAAKPRRISNSTTAMYGTSSSPPVSPRQYSGDSNTFRGTASGETVLYPLHTAGSGAFTVHDQSVVYYEQAQNAMFAQQPVADVLSQHSSWQTLQSPLEVDPGLPSTQNGIHHQQAAGHPELVFDTSGVPTSFSADISATQSNQEPGLTAVRIPSLPSHTSFSWLAADAALSQEASGLPELEQSQQYAQQQYALYQDWVLQYCQSALQLCIAAGQDSDESQPLPADALPSLLANIYACFHGRHFVEYLASSAESVKGCERCLQEVLSLLSSSPEPAEYLSLAQPLINSLAESAVCQQGASYYADYALPSFPQLTGPMTAIQRRFTSCQETAVSRVQQDIQGALEQHGWPPTICDANGRILSTIARQQGKDSRLMPPAPLLACLISIQYACEPAAMTRLQQKADVPASDASSHADAQPVMLWAAQSLASPFRAQLAAACRGADGHIDMSCTSAVFEAGIGALDACLAEVDGLSRVLEQQGSLQGISLTEEFGRCIHNLVKSILMEEVLPAVCQASGSATSPGSQDSDDSPPPSSWVALLDAAVKFDKQLISRVYPATASQVTSSGWMMPAWLEAGSVAGALTQHPEACEQWMAAEAAAVQAEMDQVLYAETALQPASFLASMPTDDLDTASQQAAWQQEFYPPEVAEQALAVVMRVVQRCTGIPGMAAKLRFLDSLAGTAVDLLVQRVDRVVSQASMFAEVQREAWLPRVCACICATRFLAQRLSDMLSDDPLLISLAEAQSQVFASASGKQEAESEAQSSKTTPLRSGTFSFLSSFGPSPARLLADELQLKLSYNPNAPVFTPVFGAQIRKLKKLHRSWCDTLARETALMFGKLVVAVKPLLASLYMRTETYDGAISPDVSAPLQPVLLYVQERLATLAAHLDSPSFRDLWRALAVSMNRFMFNYMASDQHLSFSWIGARQFQADMHAMVSILKPYTRRPEAHFRELMAACKLLTLTDDEVMQAVRACSKAALELQLQAAQSSMEDEAQAAAGEGMMQLQQMGLHHLHPDIIMKVIECRKF